MSKKSVIKKKSSSQKEAISKQIIGLILTLAENEGMLDRIHDEAINPWYKKNLKKREIDKDIDPSIKRRWDTATNRD